MRKIQNIAFVLLATLFASCINDHIEPTFCRDGELSISVSTRSAGTRGQGANDDMPAAESIVKDLQYFLYVKGSGLEAAPIYAGTITDITDNDGIDNDADRPDTPADEDDNFSKTVQIPAVALNQLFPNGATECEIYIIANYLDNTMDAEHLDGIDLTKDLAFATRKNLKAIELNTTFYELLGDVEITPTSFVMDSEGTDIVSRGTGNAINTLTSGTIYLTRAAAKVMIEVNVQNAIDVSGNEWEPITQISDPTARKMYISFYNGVTTGVIDDGTDVAGSTAVTTVTDKDAYYKVENVQLQSGKISSDGATGSTSAVTRDGESTSTSTSWVPALDFYSYANSWTDGDEDHEPYFEISIPWRKKAAGQGDSANWVTYTYTVPIAMDNNRFDRNKLYLIRLNVGALGDLSTLEEYQYSYVVLNWDEVTVNATLTRPKYFVVEKDYVEMNNLTSVSVPYTSSDAVSARITKVTRYNLSGAVAKNVEYTTADAWNNINGKPFTITPSADGNPNGSVVLSHDFVLDSTDSLYDYVPYYIYVTVTNESGFEEEIVFVQYPPIYITASQNSDYDNGSGADEYNSYYTMVNAYYTDQGGDSYTKKVDTGQSTGLGSVPGLYVSGGQNSSTNANPNSYLITISSLDSKSNNVLGDPRQSTIDTDLINLKNGSNSYWVVTQSVDYDFNITKSPTRSLTWYYPTIRDNTTKNMIAPKYRVASSYSVVHSGVVTSVDMAERRCAAYQEDGWPAGRWRLPTFAEVEFIYNLSERNRIPILFNEGTPYWCAHGAIQLSDNEVKIVTSTANSVRCVYDVWYWGDEQLPQAQRGNFTWGDMAR